MLTRVLGHAVAVLLLVGLAGAWSAAAVAQEAGWKTWTRAELGISIQRPADLYELDPEAPAEDVTGEVEWGPTDHGWSVLVTSQKLRAGQTLEAIAAEEKKRTPSAEISTVKIGNDITALRLWSLDDDALSTFVVFLDKSGTRMIAIELAIALADEDSGKKMDALRTSYNGTLALYDRMLATLKLEKK